MIFILGLRELDIHIGSLHLRVPKANKRLPYDITLTMHIETSLLQTSHIFSLETFFVGLRTLLDWNFGKECTGIEHTTMRPFVYLECDQLLICLSQLLLIALLPEFQ